MTLDQLRQQWKPAILRLAAQHGARNVRVFGSVVRGEATDASDLDLLVDMESGRSLFDFIGLQQDLESTLGCKVDVVADGGISPYLQDQIYGEAVPL